MTNFNIGFEEFTISNTQAIYAKRMQANMICNNKRTNIKRVTNNGANHKRNRIDALNHAELSQY